MISVNDILRKALPEPTRVVAGEAGLGREVTWATRLRPAPPAFEHLSGGEIVLLPPHVLEMLDERLTLDQAIRQLSGFGVVAIALSDSVDDDARKLAAADPRATLALVPGMNHVLKAVASDDRAANLATYGDPSLPLAPGVVGRIADFVAAHPAK